MNRYLEAAVGALIVVLGGVFAYKFLSPSRGWCGQGMKDILTSAVSISGTFLAVLLAMVLYVAQSSSTTPGLQNVQARGRLSDLHFQFAFAALLWCMFLVCSLALQTYSYPNPSAASDKIFAVWHAVWSGTGTGAFVFIGYLFVLLLRTASPSVTHTPPVYVPYTRKEDPTE